MTELSTYIEAVTKRVYPQASNNRFALSESVKQLLALVQAVTVEEFAFIRSNVNGGSVSRDSEWQRLPARLELLSHRLEEEGRYVDADIAHQAFEVLSKAPSHAVSSIDYWQRQGHEPTAFERMAIAGKLEAQSILKSGGDHRSIPGMVYDAVLAAAPLPPTA